MIKERFNLIFKGKVEPGKDLDEARSILKSLFENETGNQSDFFGGQAIVLGKNMDAMTASSFKQALADEGVITHIFTATTDTVAEEDNQSRRFTERRINPERRARVRSGAILPDRRMAPKRRG